MRLFKTSVVCIVYSICHKLREGYKIWDPRPATPKELHSSRPGHRLLRAGLKNQDLRKAFLARWRVTYTVSSYHDCISLQQKEANS